jgi:hypothetical protein
MLRTILNLRIISQLVHDYLTGVGGRCGARVIPQRTISDTPPEHPSPR